MYVHWQQLKHKTCRMRRMLLAQISWWADMTWHLHLPMCEISAASNRTVLQLYFCGHPVCVIEPLLLSNASALSSYVFIRTLTSEMSRTWSAPGAAEGSQKWGGTEQRSPKGQSSRPEGPRRMVLGSWTGGQPAPLPTSYRVRESCVSSPSGVPGRASTEIDFCAFLIPQKASI